MIVGGLAFTALTYLPTASATVEAEPALSGEAA
jgi:hypothetical protein